MLQWLRAHVVPDSRLVLLRGDFQCTPRWYAICVSVHTEIVTVLLDFAADIDFLPFTHGMRGPTLVSAQGCVALDSSLNGHVSLDIGVVRVESESVLPSDHYPMPLLLLTLPTFVVPEHPTS